MPSIDAFTINEAQKNVEEVLEIIWRAIEYFPKGLWKEVKYIGNIDIKYDLKVKIKEKVYNAFIFNSLLERIRKIRRIMEIDYLLLAITRDPIVAVYHRFEAKSLSRVISIVHDYVSCDIGIVSLFNVDEDMSVKITAHGLGHNRGLRHHCRPIDMMYEGLLKSRELGREGFCDDCVNKMLGVKSD